MEKLYQLFPLYRQSLLQKLFNQVPEENALIEVNNLLAAKTITSIKASEVNSIALKYNVNMYRTFKKNLYEFYATYLNHCLKDKSVSEKESEELLHLKTILNLKDKDVDEIHNKLAGPIFRRSVEELISDGSLDDRKRDLLDKIQGELKLSDFMAQKVSAEVRGKLINDFLDQAVANERLSPEDECKFEVMSRSLMIDVKMDDQTRSKLEKFKLYWQLENGELPSIQSEIILQKIERCCFMTRVDWYEQRTVTKRINYGGPVARIRIMKGLYYRVGSVSAERITSEEWTLIDSGQVYLTNKRIIFLGSKRNTNIQLSKILSFTPYSNGIEIHKETGRSPLLGFKENVDVFGILLSRLLRSK